MALVEAYAPCPCGSGEKYKWCCQKVESFVEKSIRLATTHQTEAALAALDEGLRKHPGSPWLLIRKTVLLIRQERLEEAREVIESLVRSRPTHLEAQDLLLRLSIETEDARAAVGRLQQALGAVQPDQRRSEALVSLVEMVGQTLANEMMIPAAIAHLQLAEWLSPVEDAGRDSTLRRVESEPGVAVRLRAEYRLSEVPEGLDEPKRRRFSEALAKSDQGLWASAAADYDALAREGTPEADRNLGLCRLWLGDHAGAVEALRRHTRWVGPSEDAIELEGLCQLIEPVRDEDRVELLQWIWPVRDPDALLKALEADERSISDGRQPVNAEDPESFEVDVFVMTDRPRPAQGASVQSAAELPRVEGRVLLGQEIVAVEAYDDGRLERLANRFRALAGSSITPAHPRSKEVGQTDRTSLALRSEWVTPEGLSEEEGRRLNSLERKRIYTEIWPETPEPYLDGRTPRQAAKDGNAELPLRAAISQFETTTGLRQIGIDFDALRAELGLPEEPSYDPASVEIEAVPLTRLFRIEPSKLSDDTLVALHRKASHYAIAEVIYPVLLQVVERPALMEAGGPLSRFSVFADLANLCILFGKTREDAFGWIARGRSTDRDAGTPEHAVRWDCIELRLRSLLEPPTAWVPFLAAVLDRYGKGSEHNNTLLSALVSMGLIRILPHPEREDDVQMDTRPLQMVLEQYGPKITSAGGELGVSVTGGKVWSPEQEARGSGGGVWTPGQSSSSEPPGESKSKLIIPGR